MNHSFCFSACLQRVCVMICYGKVREQFSAVELTFVNIQGISVGKFRRNELYTVLANRFYLIILISSSFDNSIVPKS